MLFTLEQTQFKNKKYESKIQYEVVGGQKVFDHPKIDNALRLNKILTYLMKLGFKIMFFT
jgi:hypothetical protein